MTDVENNRILVVDDEPKNLKIIRLNFMRDYELKEASSGEEALEIAPDFKPAVVLLDIMMPGIDGYQVAEQLRTSEATKSAKIILVSGKAMIDEKLKGYEAGADDYLTKPFNASELKAKVQVFHRLYNLEHQLKALNASLEEEVQLRIDQLLKKERLAYVGLHVSEAIHNLKSPLSVAKLRSDMLLQKDPDCQHVNGVARALDKAFVMIASILQSVHEDHHDSIQAIRLENLLNSELEFLRLNSKMRYHIAINVSIEGCGYVCATRNHIGQVIGNLIQNAVEAMTDGDKRELSIDCFDENGYSVIQVRDTGPGITPENLGRVFDPLFTTKNGMHGKPSGGTGLGLSFCQRVVEGYKGDITVESTVGVGSTFTIKLPLLDHLLTGAG